MTKLFIFNKPSNQASSINPLMIETPLGKMQFNCSFNGTSISNIKPRNILQSNSNLTLSSWVFEECYIEFLCMNFLPKLPPDMQVDKCFGGIWRIQALHNHMNFKLSGFLDCFLNPSPESGEYLLAQTFEDHSYKLTIGTEDEEALIARAASKNWLPFHFEDSLTSNSILYTNQGLEIILPESNCNDLIQVHFIVAWASKNFNPISTWYAVDQKAEDILSLLNNKNQTI